MIVELQSTLAQRDTFLQEQSHKGASHPAMPAQPHPPVPIVTEIEAYEQHIQEIREELVSMQQALMEKERDIAGKEQTIDDLRSHNEQLIDVLKVLTRNCINFLRPPSTRQLFCSNT